MKYRFRFAERDREQYGEGWYEGDLTVVDWDRPGMVGLVERFETETGYAMPGGLIAGLLAPFPFHRVKRALLWWAVLLAGKDVRFDDFQPRVDLAESGYQGNRQGPQKRATKSTATLPGKAGRTTGKRSASTSRTTS